MKFLGIYLIIQAHLKHLHKGLRVQNLFYKIGILSLHRKIMRLGMQAKLLFTAIPILIVFTMIVSFGIIERENSIMYQNTVQQGMSIAKSAALLYTNARIYEELRMVDSAGMSEYLEYFMQDMMLLDPRMRGYFILNTDGRVLAHNQLREYGKIYDSDEIKKLLRDKKDFINEVYAEEGQHILHITVPLVIASKFWGLCRINFSLDEMYAYNSSLRDEILSLACVLLVISSIMVWLVGRHFVSPIRELTKNMKAITLQGSIAQSEPVLDEREDEIGKLQSSFAWMLTRLHEVEEERSRNIEGMLQADKLATVGQLASGIAHEINNPLGGIILCFQNLCEGEMDEKMRQQHVDVINASLEKIRCTVSEFLRFARPTPLSIRQSSVEEIFTHCLSLADFTLSRHGSTIYTELMPNMPMVQLDPDKIGQVLLNLVLNAAYAVNPTQDSNNKNSAVLLKAYTKQNELVIIVADTGPGVSKDIQEKIFNPFFSEKPEGKGTGLGLAVSIALIAQHGGTLKLITNEQPLHEGVLYSGAVFEIKIPLTVCLNNN